MTETFVVTGDVLSRTLVPVVGLRVEKLPSLPRPWYLPEPPAWRPDVKAGRAQMARLAAQHPRNVKGYN